MGLARPSKIVGLPCCLNLETSNGRSHNPCLAHLVPAFPAVIGFISKKAFVYPPAAGRQVKTPSARRYGRCEWLSLLVASRWGVRAQPARIRWAHSLSGWESKKARILSYRFSFVMGKCFDALVVWFTDTSHDDAPVQLRRYSTKGGFFCQSVLAHLTASLPRKSTTGQDFTSALNDTSLCS